MQHVEAGDDEHVLGTARPSEAREDGRLQAALQTAKRVDLLDISPCEAARVTEATLSPGARGVRAVVLWAHCDGNLHRAHALRSGLPGRRLVQRAQCRAEHEPGNAESSPPTHNREP